MRVSGSLLEIFVFQSLELVYAHTVSAAAKAAAEKRIDHFESYCLADYPGTESQYVCIVMLTADPCCVLVMRQCAADSLELVACNGYADTRSADGDALLCFSRKDVICDKLSCLDP